MLPSKPRKPIHPPGRGRRTKEERDTITAEELRRTAERRAEIEREQEQTKIQERMQNKIQRAQVHGIRKFELEPWELETRSTEQINQKTCTQCGELGWNRFWCPNCDCLICKSPEHIARDCPDLKDSRFADKHVATEKHQEASVKSRTDWRSRQWSSSSIFVSIPAPGPKGPVSTKILPFQDWPKFSATVIFPASLKDLAHTLAESMMRNEVRETHPLRYPERIQSYGGIGKLVKDTMDCINAPVSSLQNEEVTPERCLAIQKEQMAAASGSVYKCQNGGYLDFVTDSRDNTYIRFYVGQSIVILFRVDTHIREILKGSYTTLHYYILQLGRGCRTSNWLRLWTIPDKFDRPPTHQELLQNFLEMLFCGAFQSLPTEELIRYFGDKLKISSNVGLNVLSPLLQGLDLSDRESFRASLLNSLDPEIQSWPLEQRRRQQNLPKRRLIATPPVSRTTYQDQIKRFTAIFRKMVHDVSPISDEDCLDTFRLQEFPDMPSVSQSEWEQMMENFFASPSRIPPLGNIQSAKIGFLVDTIGLPDRLSSTLPPSLLSIGFHPGNSILWMANFRDQICDPGPTSRSDNVFTAELIRNSKLKVILLCGFTPQSELVEDMLLGEPEIIQLRGQDINIWIKPTIIEGQYYYRAFIATPEIYKLRGSHWRTIQKFGEVFRLAGLLTGVNLDCYLLEKAKVFARLFRQVQLERDYRDTPLWKVDTLDPLIRHWLFCKGFQKDDDLINLEKLVGSLAIGICMLTHVFPRRNGKFAPETTGSRTSAGKRNNEPRQNVLHFDREIFVAVEKLYQSLQPESSAANEDAPTSEEEVNPDSDEHDCGLVIDSSSELPPPAIIIEDSANIIADNEAQSFRSRMQYEGIENIKDERAPLVPFPFRLDLSQIKELMSLPDQTLSSRALRINLLSPTGRRVKIKTTNLGSAYVMFRFLYIAVPQELLEGTYVNICMELAPKNENHAHAWLEHSKLLERDDPALRLAIRYQVDSQDANAAYTTNWLHFRKRKFWGTETRHDLLKRIFKVNALVDFLDGDSAAEIARRPRRCYAYLSDVSVSEHQGSNRLFQQSWELAFRKSRWFTRGWTLQELLASPLVEFFSKERIRLGDKTSLEREIHEITRIHVQALRGDSLSEFSIQERISWTAKRETKRVEDKAYSLFGIFDICIPILYGEGEKRAVNRLLEELDKHIRQDPTLGPLNPQKKDEKKINALIESLRFDDIGDRYNSIRPAHAGTCRWLLDHPTYLAWIDSRKLHEHNGLLWVKGKPGVGKSTLMKFALAESEHSTKNVVNISFFFNARGSRLEKDTLGMYQSLLFQLFDKFKVTHEVFEKFDLAKLPQAPTFVWRVELLKEMLRLAIRKIDGSSLRIFVDALDECDEDQIRDMVRFFELLTGETIISCSGLLVCFSSRHYPRITVTKVIEIVLENEIEHTRDIRNYIASELKLQPSVVHERLRDTILSRASGVFIWVVLAVQILRKANDHGHVHNMEKKLGEIPDDLGQLFESILARDKQNVQEMKLCIQWILFAKRPLRREELYYAILSSIYPEGLIPWNPEDVTVEVMDRFILSSSKGLAQYTSSSTPTVQFIHETVRDFLLSEKGMQYIQQNTNAGLLGPGNDILKQCCALHCSAAYLNSTERGSSANMQDYPLFEYAIHHVLQHAEAAARNGVPQISFLREFSVETWVRLLSSIGRSWRPNSSLLYILAVENLSALVTTWLNVEPRFSIEVGNEMSPIIAALCRGNAAAIRALLTPNAGSNHSGSAEQAFGGPSLEEVSSMACAYHYYRRLSVSTSSSPLSWFFMENYDELAALIVLQSGRAELDDKSPHLSISPLYYAASHGYNLLIEFLLETHQVDIEFRDEFQRTSLAIAARNGRDNAVQLLVRLGKADVNPRNSNGQTPLSLAAQEGHGNVVATLVNIQGVEIDSQDAKNRTPFFHAASRGYEQIVKLLLETQRVDINSRDNYGQTPLSYAVLHGHKNVVNVLLDMPEIEVNTQDHRGRTPLSFAKQYGYSSIARCLLDRARNTSSQAA